MPRDMPSLNALRSFEAAARLESVSRAADELNVTHGAVSRQLRSLEEELGVALFEKSGRGLKLTDSGRRLRDACAQAFGDLRDACTAVRQAQAQAPFLLACPGSLLARWFIPRLDRLNRELPQLNLHLSASEAELDPRRPGVTATLLFAAPPWPADLVAYPLLAERIGPVFSPRLPSAQRLQGSPAEALLGEPLLHTTSRQTAWLDWATNTGLDPAHLRQGQGFEHLYYLLEAALAGIGVAIAPELLVADDIAAGRLVAPWGFVDTGNQLALLAASRQPQTSIDQLAQWLAANLGIRQSD
ncbi:transcriptional regulator, LysR family [Halopseudomonas xinjiangensis]|uniref:HTH-type transcriptional regulator TrpI n=1 Tax=Halopseudomonas xinjiangensis TaxID=487184 RepID=A0A1H1XXB8_9GAMM|nr:LysR family transcriptional regulator [Halopseudomonas xinjiangensis]SDT13884.1 transcriptional regulator, LysR family [Halopseudomonas xinjiangensis]